MNCLNQCKKQSITWSLSESDIDASANKEVKFKAGPAELEFMGENYVGEWVYPNFYFHLTTTYNILRHNGLAIGKLYYPGIEPQAWFISTSRNAVGNVIASVT